MIEYDRALLTNLNKDLKKLGFKPKMMSAMKTNSYVFCEFSKGYADKSLNYKDSYWCTYIQEKCSVYYAKFKAWFEYLESIRENNKQVDDYLNSSDTI
jgi:hypothetical protein